MSYSSGKSAHDVFGVTPAILQDSYVDRGDLDARLTRELGRSHHLALRGESKCGKSWLRQKIVINPIVVQCRLGKPVVDVYTDILSQLEILLTLENSSTGKLKGTIEATGSVGAGILGKLGIKLGAEGARESTSKTRVAGHTVDDLKFVSDIIAASGRRVIVEDFHYMNIKQRTIFAHDLKTFWDYKLYFIIVGVWTKTNMLVSLNSDLSNRIKEISIVWTDKDFYSLIDKGSAALGVKFSEPIRNRLVKNCFGNVAILQRIALGTLDNFESNQEQNSDFVNNVEWVESAELEYAEELDALYQTFAKRLAASIRTRKDSTGINAHMMAVILESTDSQLMDGLSIDTIYSSSHSRQSRIQKGNLRTVLENFERRQIDSEGKGLVFSYNEHSGHVTIVDKQLLFYRKFSTLNWPWDEMIKDIEQTDTGYEKEDHAT